MFVVLVFAAAPRRTVSAQVCYDANQKVIPCPEQQNPEGNKEENRKKKRTPRPPIPTYTATSTETPTATATPTSMEL
jgi:hypothetical protein